MHTRSLYDTDRDYIALGLEGSANKLGAGVIKHSPNGTVTVLSNVRHTYITPPGEGFLPRDTAKHHRDWVMTVIRDSLKKAGISMHDLDWINAARMAAADAIQKCRPAKAHIHTNWQHWPPKEAASFLGSSIPFQFCPPDDQPQWADVWKRFLSE